MELKILGSSFEGSCYLLQNGYECLILECGISFKEVKKALNYNLSEVVGCLVTNENEDHCKAIKAVLNSGINVYMSSGTKEVIGINNYGVKTVKAFNTFKVGGFTILPFDVKHYCEEPLGYVIHHKDTGSILFVTDTYYMDYKFNNMAHIIAEDCYHLDIFNQNNGLRVSLLEKGMKNKWRM